VQTWKVTWLCGSYVTHFGKLTGVITESGQVDCQAKNIGKKNQTTAEEQCEKEVLALYEKKIKEGYHFDVNSIDNFVFFQPMLAKKWLDDYVKKGKFDPNCSYILQTKLNGMRAVVTKHGMWSRTGEKIVSSPHIRLALVQFFEKYPEAVLDGELYNYDLRQKLSEMMSVAGQKKPTLEDFKRSEQIVQYWIYDGSLTQFELDAPYTIRIEELQRRVRENLYSHLQSIRFVESHYASTLEDIDTFFNTVVSDGEEGIIVRVHPCPYENKRSKYLLEYKPTDDDEFLFRGVSEGTGTWAGSAKIIHLTDKEGKEFNGTFKGTLEDAVWLLHNHSHLISKWVTCTYNSFTSYGIPNSAQFSLKNQKFDVRKIA
jgi:ATP-dependent DNA ligase